MVRTPLIAAAALVASFLSIEAQALSFAPTESEWRTWPEHCRARYVDSAAGRGSEFARSISSSQVRNWERRIGEAWYAMHHYCAAIVIIERAKHTDALHRKRLLENAIGEIQFTIERTPRTSFWYAEMLSKQALAHSMLGNQSVAVTKLDEAISLHPQYLSSYLTKSRIARDHGDLAGARAALESADKATEGKSVEIQYALGLICVDSRDFTAAQQYARTAYSMGHPLPGLRDKLAASGHPIE